MKVVDKMSLETVQIRRYIEHFSQYEVKPLSTREKIEIGRPKLFDFYYPFFDDNKKKEFETNIIRRFYFTDIGFEVFELFKFHLENWLIINMPYWNNMFKSELLEYEPFLNTIMDKDGTIDTTKDTDSNRDGTIHQDTKDDGTMKQDTTTNATSDGTSEGTGNKVLSNTGNKNGTKGNKGTSNNFGRNVEADTPDSRLAITTDDGKGILEYASKITEDTQKGSTTSDDTFNEDTKSDGEEDTKSTGKTHDEMNGTSHTTGETHNTGSLDGTTNDKFDENVKGNQKSVDHYVGKIGTETYQEMLQKYRSTFLRIEKMIHEEMRRDLFLLTY
jgi:hypothetical protein